MPTGYNARACTAQCSLSGAKPSVRPKTTMSALAGSDVAFGSAGAGTSITADTQAAGIDAGAGNDAVVNRGKHHNALEQ